MIKAKLFKLESLGPEGQRVETLVARGDDLSFWMEPDYLELRPAELQIIRQKDPALIQTEPRSGKVLVNLNASIRLLSPPERQVELYILASEHLGTVADVNPDKWDLL